MEINIPYSQTFSQSANRIKVTEGKFYKTSCKAKIIEGEKFCAYFAVIMLDSNGKEILRRIRWFNELTNDFSEYPILCRAEPNAQFMVVGYFANGHGSNKSNLILDLSNLQESKIEESEERNPIFDELYDYKLIWSRNKGIEKNDFQRIGQTKQEFESGGQTILSLLIKAGLKTDSKFLDIGCGFGRTTNALIKFFDKNAQYYGIDIGKESIEFCKKNYQRQNFVFIQIEDSEIPIENTKFDMMLFSSVFTHLYPDQIREYLKQCKTKLNDNGVIVADILEKNDINDFAGMVSKIIFNRQYFEEILKSEDFEFEVIGDFGGQKWDVDKRPVFKLKPQKV